MNMNMAAVLSETPPVTKKFNLYACFVAIMPMLATYASGIPGFSVTDVLLVFFTVYAALHIQKHPKNRYLIRVDGLVLGIVMIVAFSLIAMMLDSSDIANVAIRTVRYIFYLLAFLFTAKRLLDFDRLQLYVKRVSVLATGYIFLQFFMYKLFGVILKGYISFLPLYVPGYATTDYEFIYSAIMYRPTSFFLEPAHFARYAIIGLVLFLFSKDIRTSGIIASLAISLGIILSTSSQGYFLLALAWFVFVLGCVFKAQTRAKRIFGVLCVLAAPLLLYIVLSIPAVQSTIERTLSGSISDTNTALGGRLGGYECFFDLPPVNKIFGVGFGSVPEDSWLASAAYWLYGSGIIVFFIYVVFLLYALSKLKGAQRMILLIMFVLFFTDDSFYSYMCVLFYSLTLLSPVMRYKGQSFSCVCDAPTDTSHAGADTDGCSCNCMT